MKYKIIDNFLDNSLADILEYSISKPNFISWESLCPKVDKFNSMNELKFKECKGQTHFLVIKNNKVSKFSFLIEPILDEIYNIFQTRFVISGVRLNRDIAHLNEPDNRIDVPHVDVKIYDKNQYTIIYYINDCDSKTILYNEEVMGSDLMNDFDGNLSIMKEVSSIKNRMVIFKSNILHSAPSYCYEDRYVMNLNITTEFPLNL